MDGISRSMLESISISPLHYKHALEAEDDIDPAAAAIGTVVHDLILKPSTAYSRTLLCPEYNAKSSTERKAHADWLAANGTGFNVVSKAQMELCKTLASKASESACLTKHLAAHHPYFKDSESASEVSLVYHMEDLGFTIKGRLDFIGDGFILDIKTTNKTPTERNFKRTIWDYGYLFQAAFYTILCRNAGLFEAPDFIFAVVEKEEPHDIVLYRINKLDIAEEIERVYQMFHTYSVCNRTNTWPGLQGGDEVRTLSLRNRD